MTSLGQRLQQFNLIVKRNSGHVVVWIIDRCFSAHQRILTGRILIEGELGCQNYEPTGTKTDSSKGKRSIAFYNNVPTFFLFIYFFRWALNFLTCLHEERKSRKQEKKNKKQKKHWRLKAHLASMLGLLQAAVRQRGSSSIWIDAGWRGTQPYPRGFPTVKLLHLPNWQISS